MQQMPAPLYPRSHTKMNLCFKEELTRLRFTLPWYSKVPTFNKGYKQYIQLPKVLHLNQNYVQRSQHYLDMISTYGIKENGKKKIQYCKRNFFFSFFIYFFFFILWFLSCLVSIFVQQPLFNAGVEAWAETMRLKALS